MDLKNTPLNIHVTYSDKPTFGTHRKMEVNTRLADGRDITLDNATASKIIANLVHGGDPKIVWDTPLDTYTKVNFTHFSADAMGHGYVGASSVDCDNVSFVHAMAESDDPKVRNQVELEGRLLAWLLNRHYINSEGLVPILKLAENAS